MSIHQPGTTLDSKYEVLRPLGGGGFGEVLLVRHVHLEERRVIKILRREHASDPAAAERFLRTARMATQIKHPNVAILHDYAQFPDGRFYMVWEYVEGEELGDRVDRGGPLPLDLAVEIGIQALRGLEAIHSAGVIHRDISPDNLLLTRDAQGRARVKVIDLGLAKSLDPENQDLTESGMFMGKLRYCSPEQAGMLEGVSLDRRTDLYSFATVLYEAICGKAPFESASPHGAVFLRLNEDPLPLAGRTPEIEVPESLDRAVLRGLARDREERYPSAVAFIQALERAREEIARIEQVRRQTQKLEPIAETIPMSPADSYEPAREDERVEQAEALLDGHLDAGRLGLARLALETLLDLAPNHPLRKDYKRRCKALADQLNKQKRATEVLDAGRDALFRGDLRSAQRKLSAINKADPTGEISKAFAREIASAEMEIDQTSQLTELQERFDLLIERGFVEEAEVRLREIAELEVSKVRLDLLRSRLREARDRRELLQESAEFEDRFRTQIAAGDWPAARQVAFDMGRVLPDSPRPSQMLSEISRLEERRQRNEAIEQGARQVELLLAAGQREQAALALDVLRRMAPDHPRSLALAQRLSEL